VNAECESIALKQAATVIHINFKDISQHSKDEILAAWNSSCKVGMVGTLRVDIDIDCRNYVRSTMTIGSSGLNY
jgi:hypothetical protein